ncbi:TetR/AcrR family transcriptional regulator [Fodinibius saliphilus]|uniref:TetR/AcrR family transcriptional regulator n=1 Tax=Fodinibius saliphilus TaxID=1920650 RepID=UPI001108C704|nr:TetR/AcrR family transcriptional regulator [Fodinibius saliphilus]
MDDTFDPEIFELKFQLADVATDLYIEGDGDFLIKEVAQAADLTPAEVFNYFANKKSILEFYYASLVIRYEMMISEIDSFESYTIKEKLSNFIFTNFDLLSEKEAFVEDTFKEYIIHSYSKTDYEKEVERLTKQFLENDDQISITSTLALNSYAYSFLRRQYLELIRFWLNDTSDDKELTMELTDKLTGVLEEMLYNPVLDKSFDLLKFINANRKEFFKNIPVVKQVCSKIEIK